jgi:hypothetical protein
MFACPRHVKFLLFRTIATCLEAPLRATPALLLTISPCSPRPSSRCHPRCGDHSPERAVKPGKYYEVRALRGRLRCQQASEATVHHTTIVVSRLFLCGKYTQKLCRSHQGCTCHVLSMALSGLAPVHVQLLDNRFIPSQGPMFHANDLAESPLLNSPRYVYGVR